MAPNRITNPEGNEMNTTPQADHVADLRKLAADIAKAGINGFGNRATDIADRIEAMQRQGEPKLGFLDAESGRAVVVEHHDWPESQGFQNVLIVRAFEPAAGGASR
jgi:hypothetical protein